MDIQMTPISGPEGKPSRLFTISLQPKETVGILDSPGGFYITEHKTHAQFCIWKKPFIDEKNIVFQYGDECYNFISKTGFKTNEEHLNWLVSLGKIPMMEDTNVFNKTKSVHMGYVRFVDEATMISEPSKETPLEAYFLSKLLKSRFTR